MTRPADSSLCRFAWSSNGAFGGATVVAKNDHEVVHTPMATTSGASGTLDQLRETLATPSPREALYGVHVAVDCRREVATPSYRHTLRSPGTFTISGSFVMRGIPRWSASVAMSRS